jgi:hypothetical protein
MGILLHILFSVAMRPRAREEFFPLACQRALSLSRRLVAHVEPSAAEKELRQYIISESYSKGLCLRINEQFAGIIRLSSMVVNY